MKEFEVLEERSLDSSTLDEVRLPLGDVVQNATTDRLLGVADRVVDVDERVPVLAPVNRVRVLTSKCTKHSYLYRAAVVNVVS